jgi:hypothetical protein
VDSAHRAGRSESRYEDFQEAQGEEMTRPLSALERVKHFMEFAPYDGFRSFSGKGPDLEMTDLRLLIAVVEAARKVTDFAIRHPENCSAGMCALMRELIPAVNQATEPSE